MCQDITKSGLFLQTQAEPPAVHCRGGVTASAVAWQPALALSYPTTRIARLSLRHWLCSGLGVVCLKSVHLLVIKRRGARAENWVRNLLAGISACDQQRGNRLQRPRRLCAQNLARCGAPAPPRSRGPSGPPWPCTCTCAISLTRLLLLLLPRYTVSINDRL
jgi:hypothetical protein